MKNVLVEKRIERGLSVKDVVYFSGIKESVVRRWEVGLVEGTHLHLETKDALYKVAKLFDMPIAALEIEIGNNYINKKQHEVEFKFASREAKRVPKIENWINPLEKPELHASEEWKEDNARQLEKLAAFTQSRFKAAEELREQGMDDAEINKILDHEEEACADDEPYVIDRTEIVTMPEFSSSRDKVLENIYGKIDYVDFLYIFQNLR